MKRAAKNLKLSRKRIVIILSALVVILLVAYGGLSTWTWSQYKESYTSWKGSVKSKLDSAKDMSVATAEQKAKWLDALNAASNMTAEPNKCSLNVAYTWQQVIIPALKSEVADCQRSQDAMNTLHDSLMIAVKGIRADEAIAAILSEPLKTTTVNEAAYQGEIDTWAKAAASLRAVDAPNETVGVKTAAISAAEAIKAAWSALLAANTVQNATQYQTALNSLTGAYSSLNTVSNESKKALQTAANAVQKAYDDAF